MSEAAATAAGVGGGTSCERRTAACVLEARRRAHNQMSSGGERASARRGAAATLGHPLRCTYSHDVAIFSDARDFFSGARDSIFDAIDVAIWVAAADHPDGLRTRCYAISERLYTALIAFPPAEAPELAAPWPPFQHRLLPDGADSVPSVCSSDRAEAVTDDGSGGKVFHRDNDSDDPVVADAFCIKAALSDAQQKAAGEQQHDLSEAELLRRLRQLEFTVDAIMEYKFEHGQQHFTLYQDFCCTLPGVLCSNGYKLTLLQMCFEHGDRIHVARAMKRLESRTVSERC